MKYPYRCSDNHEWDVIKSVKDIDNVENCERCGKIGVRYIANTYFYGASDWDKTEFNPGLGQITRNRKHRDQIAKQRGLEEVGTEPVENIHKHADSVNEYNRNSSWDKT